MFNAPRVNGAPAEDSGNRIVFWQVSTGGEGSLGGLRVAFLSFCFLSLPAHVRVLLSLAERLLLLTEPMFPPPLPSVWLRQRRTSSRVWPEHPWSDQRTAGGACFRQHNQGVEPRWQHQDQCAESERGSRATTLQVGALPLLREDWDCSAACLNLTVCGSTTNKVCTHLDQQAWI